VSVNRWSWPAILREIWLSLSSDRLGRFPLFYVCDDSNSSAVHAMHSVKSRSRLTALPQGGLRPKYLRPVQASGYRCQGRAVPIAFVHAVIPLRAVGTT
jgi:hypothetical protein